MSGESIGFGTAVIVALIAAVGAMALAYLLVPAIGAGGLIVAGVLTAAALGVAVSAMFGVEIKRSFLIGALFMVIHIGVAIGFHMAAS
jgi:hypothetical protein